VSANKIQEIVNGMDPEEAAAEIALAMKKLFTLLGEEARIKFVMNLVGDSGEDKVGSMVHL
jgi:hypothetical protein